MKVTLTLPWIDQDGNEHEQESTVDVDRATGETLVFLGRARGADAGEIERGYNALTVPELKARIAERNEGRDESRLLPAEGHKADLVAALTADDVWTIPTTTQES